MAKELNKENFDSEITNYKGAALVDFWAPWCGPCRMMGPIIDSLSTKLEGQVKIVKVNIDDSPDLAAKFSVSTIPTLVFFKNGEAIHTTIGVTPEPELENLIKEKLL